MWGRGFRIQLELLGPEYSMEFSSLGTGLKVFISRAVKGAAGEDLVEKQNAEQGLMPALEDEAGVYGYTSENRHMVECFRTGVTPSETFRDGFAVTEILMALYRSAELGAHGALRRGGFGGLHPAGGQGLRLTLRLRVALAELAQERPDLLPRSRCRGCGCRTISRQASGSGSRLGQLWPPPSTRSSLTALSGSAQPVQTTSRTRLLSFGIPVVQKVGLLAGAGVKQAKMLHGLGDRDLPPCREQPTVIGHASVVRTSDGQEGDRNGRRAGVAVFLIHRAGGGRGCCKGCLGGAEQPV